MIEPLGRLCRRLDISGSGDTALTEEESEALEEQYHEDMDDDDNEMFGFYDWLIDKGYESYGCNYQIFMA